MYLPPHLQVCCRRGEQRIETNQTAEWITREMNYICIQQIIKNFHAATPQ